MFLFYFSGMRTHIRMHFERKSTDFNEETYISCTLDEENTEVPPTSAAIASSSSTSNQIASPEIVQPVGTATAQTYHCEKCNYTTILKGKLVIIKYDFFVFMNILFKNKSFSDSTHESCTL